MHSFVVGPRYKIWRAGRAHAENPGQLDLAAIVSAAEACEKTPAHVDAELAGFDAFFAPLICSCPELSELLLNDALRIDPHERPTAHRLADTLMPWVERMPNNQIKAYQDAVKAQVLQQGAGHFVPNPHQKLAEALRTAALQVV